MMRRILWFAVALCVAMSGAAAEDELIRRALEARGAGDYPAAIKLLRTAVAEHPRADVELLLAETLAWTRQFADAANVYRTLLQAEPDSRDALLGLARVRLWQGRYREASALFAELLRRNPSDADATEGHATAAYWSGDFRTAAREFSGLGSDFARRSLAEIRSATRSSSQLVTTDLHDDQPFHSTRTAAEVTYFSDPLTRWAASAGSYRLSSGAAGTHQAPFANVESEIGLPQYRINLSASLGGLRAPDGSTHATGGAAARIRLWPHSTLTLSVARRELFTNATRQYPFVSTLSARWIKDEPWLASVEAERLHYSDHNSGTGVNGYVLLPVINRQRWTLWAGASALYRDTAEQRFRVVTITGNRDPITGFFDYEYRGAYDPYWTPEDLIEARAILAIERSFGAARIKVQADAGRARDQALGFGPQRGASPLPAAVASAPFRRSFEPRRVRVTLDAPLAKGMFVTFGFEHSITAYYEANTFNASLGRRR